MIGMLKKLNNRLFCLTELESLNKENNLKSAISKVKKQRGANTAMEQYEEYIKFLENHELFRTGTINPENYMKQKWEELTIELNSKPKDPQLTTDKWIQRFSD
ncbi:unnamed protein product [Psylliodes chrysocephalus]|uniref:Uncharacterized protein n=1 Tax=Psylliodes chrysocephalus TaxID=3402493 RepID=A0A9P0D5T9_9CUCU|nr:unnamed protein product [Psylliodes chrysocephala]